MFPTLKSWPFGVVSSSFSWVICNTQKQAFQSNVEGVGVEGGLSLRTKVRNFGSYTNVQCKATVTHSQP